MQKALWRSIEISVVLVSFILPGLGSEGQSNSGQGTMLALAQPVALSVKEQFPTTVAGISAYLNVGQPIDLARAREVLQGVEAEGDDYLIGIVALEGYFESQWPHMYVDTQGWMIAYYSKNDPASKLMPWATYEGGVLNTTTLEEALAVFTRNLFRAMRLPFDFSQVEPNIEYYDFRYPEATRLLLIADSISSTGEKVYDSCRFEIPLEVVIYEASWLHFAKGMRWSSAWTTFWIDDAQLNRMEGSGTYYTTNLMPIDFLIPTVAHTLYVWVYDSSGLAGIAVAFIYR